MDQNQQKRLESALEGWNPWWRGAPIDAGLRREALVDVARWLGQIEVLAVCGIRRCGKSTLMLQAVQYLLDSDIATPDDILLVNLEDPVLLGFDPRAGQGQVLQEVFELYRRWRRPTRMPWVFLDEVQNVAGWARWVRAASDKRLAHFVVSGSSSRILEPELASTLTGRCITRTLWPLSFGEFCRFRRPGDGPPGGDAGVARLLPDYLADGGMPRAVLDRDPRRRVERLKQTFRDIIYRDIVSWHDVRTVRALEEVAHHYLVNTARESSHNSVKRKYDLGIDQVRRYAHYLEECYLVGTLPRHAFKPHVRARAPRKVYARDLGIRNAVAAGFSPDRGALAETAVYGELCRDPEVELSYFVGPGCECDFVVRRGHRTETAIQVCDAAAGALPVREERGLLAALEALDLSEGWLITGGGEAWTQEVGGHTIHRVPLADWLLDPARRGAAGA